MVVFALSIPRGGKSRYYVPAGMPIKIQCFEKEWWTDDPSLEEWYEEPWEPAGSVPITVIRAGPAENLGTASSRYWFPINVDFVWYTIKETTPVYIIRLLQTPMDDCSSPEALAISPWTPSYKICLGDMPRGCTCYLAGIRRTVAYRIQPKSFTFTFVSVAGPRTAEVTFSGSIEFTIEPQNFEIEIGMYDWSMAPPDVARLVCTPATHHATCSLLGTSPTDGSSSRRSAPLRLTFY